MTTASDKGGAGPHSPDRSYRVQGREHFWCSFTPIPALIVLIAILYYTVSSSAFYEPGWLLPITNTVFVGLVCFAVAFVAARNYKANGRIQVLLLGCGVLVFGIGGIVAAFLRSVPKVGANLNVTVYNTGALLGAVFHFVAALFLLTGISPEAGSRRKDWWLVLGYAGSIAFMGLLTTASLKSIIPPFFIQTTGPTSLRQGILGAADFLFAFAFLVFMGNYLRNREIFLYWYSCALALTTISLTAFLIEKSIGGAVGWAGRSSQYLGGIYFFIALLAAARSAGVRQTSLDNVLTASLSPAEEKFRALAENAPDMIRRFDREMKHIYVNPATLRFYGKPAGSIIGKSIEEAGLSESQCRLWRDRIERVFETGRRIDAEEFLDTRDGARFYQSFCVPEYAADGTVANILVLSRDLTERKQAEETLRRTAEELQRSNLDLEQFASVAGHDLQEPLRLVRGFLSLLEQRYAPQLDEDAKKYIRHSVESAQRMSQLIADLLAYSRIGHKGGRFRPVETDKALSHALANLQGSIQEAAAAVTHDELPAVNGDHVQLLQLFQNLVGNAIKFRSPDRQCQVHVGLRRQDGSWLFFVRDNGIGIPKDSFDRIFHLFQRLHTRTEYGGTGIGLAVCKKIVERHGGRIWVESVLGEGSTFCFVLPAASDVAHPLSL
jgi:PAS domain S-box-containing protein